MKNRVVKLLASGGGAGYLRPASGTWGTAVGAVLAMILWYIYPVFFFSWVGTTIVAGGVIASSLIATAALAAEPTAGDDPHWIVIDEIIGLFTALISSFYSLWYLVLAFFIFRLFDITKPFPARQAEDLPRGWGVVIDDVIAGLYTNLSLHLIAWVAAKF